jgi:hypothetical protein
VEKASRSMKHRGTRRGGRNLETALKALSTPFVPSPAKPVTPANEPGRSLSRERSFRSHFSDVTLPSALNMTPEMVSSAEEIVLNARRKQAILLGIIVKLQRCCKRHLVRMQRLRLSRNDECVSEPHERDQRKIRSSAALRIHCWVRMQSARFKFMRIRRATVVLQAYRRGLIVRETYRMLIYAIAKVQAVYRGHTVRERLSFVSLARLRLYKLVIFSLWCKASTPLSYRTKFWPHLKSAGLVRLFVAEQELKRLWSDLNMKFATYSENGEHWHDLEHRIANQLGLSNVVYWTARQVLYKRARCVQLIRRDSH